MLWFKALLPPFKKRAWNGLRLELWGAVGRKQCFVLQGVQAPTTLNCFIHPQHRQSWPLLESKSIESTSRDLIYIHTKRSTFLATSSFLFNMHLQNLIPLSSSLSRPICEGWWMQLMINEKKNTAEARGLGCIHLQECFIWTYPEARMEKEEDGSWLSLENAFHCRPTEMLLSF